MLSYVDESDEYLALTRAYRRTRSEGKLMALLGVGEEIDDDSYDYATVDVRLSRSGEDMMVALIVTPLGEELTEIEEERFMVALPLLVLLRVIREKGRGDGGSMLGTGVDWEHLGTRKGSGSLSDPADT